MPYEVIAVKPSKLGYEVDRSREEVAEDIKNVYEHGTELGGQVIAAHQIATQPWESTTDSMLVKGVMHFVDQVLRGAVTSHNDFVPSCPTMAGDTIDDINKYSLSTGVYVGNTILMY